MTWGPPPGDPWAPSTPSGDAPAPNSYGATAWYPGAPAPTGPAPVAPGPTPGPPPGPPPSARKSTPRAAVIVVVAALVVAVGVTVGLVLGTGSDDKPVAGGDATTSASTAPASGVGRTTTTATVTVSTTPTSAPTTAPAPPPAQSYTGPGGIRVQGPTGWVLDTSAGIANVADYRIPTSPERLRGSTFRIGIGNPDPGVSFSDEVEQSVAFLQSQYSATILGQATTSFLGVEAVDIEYTYYNSDLGVQRHGIERLWRSGSITLIIQSSDVDANWAAAAVVFQQLVSTASVS